MSLLDRLIRLHQEGAAGEAVATAHKALSEAQSLEIRWACASIFIDRGGELWDRSAIDLGIQLMQGFVDAETDRLRDQARYNLANGFRALAFYHEHTGDHEARLEAWKQERDQLQAIIVNGGEVPNDLVPNILTNFGNSLSQLGRKAEAISYYKRALALKPNHPVAKGSLAQLLLDFLGIQPKYNAHLLWEALRLTSDALSDPAALLSVSGEDGVKGFKKTAVRITQLSESLIETGVQGLEAHIAKLRTSHKGWNPGEPMTEWVKKNLLLTVNPHPEWCPATLQDDLFFDGLGTSPDAQGEERFTLLAHTLNQIKEQFATARYLYWLGRSPDRTTAVSSLTQYADTLDYADFGLPSGLLKASIRLSVDSLDTVANFLNRYLELGIPEKQVSFSTVWYEKGNSNKGIDHPVLAQRLADSGWLRGIRDVAETINVYPAPVRSIRHRATHDYLIIENAVRPMVRLHGHDLPMDAHQLTLQLLTMVKGVTINLVALVRRREAMLATGKDSGRLPMPFELGRGISDQLGGP